MKHCIVDPLNSEHSSGSVAWIVLVFNWDTTSAAPTQIQWTSMPASVHTNLFSRTKAKVLLFLGFTNSSVFSVLKSVGFCCCLLQVLLAGWSNSACRILLQLWSHSACHYTFLVWIEAAEGVEWRVHTSRHWQSYSRQPRYPLKEFAKVKLSTCTQTRTHATDCFRERNRKKTRQT